MANHAGVPSDDGSELRSFKLQRPRLDRDVPAILWVLLMLLVPFLIRAFLPIGAGGTTTVVGRSISIEDFLVGIQVNEASSLDVTETLRLRFNGQWEGIHRFIPVESRSPNGVPHRIGLRLHDVTDDCGRHLKVQRSRHGDDVDLKIYVPDAADALRTVIIRYRVDNGVRFLADHDELYWNVTGDQWPYPIGSARAKITLPERLVNVRANAFTGATGSKEQAVSIKVDGVAHEPENIFKPAGESPPRPAGRTWSTSKPVGCWASARDSPRLWHGTRASSGVPRFGPGRGPHGGSGASINACMG